MLITVGYVSATKSAHVREPGGSIPAGSVNIGSFEHPDETYPDSYVLYHGVRDLLYKRSEANPANAAMFPKNITDMGAVTITQD